MYTNSPYFNEYVLTHWPRFLRTKLIGDRWYLHRIDPNSGIELSTILNSGSLYSIHLIVYHTWIVLDN